MRCILQKIVLWMCSALFNVLDFLSNLNQRLAVSIELSLALTLGRLYHERLINRPRHCRCMISKIHQSLCNILDSYSTVLFEIATVKHTLMPWSSMLSSEHYSIVRLKHRGHVVRV